MMRAWKPKSETEVARPVVDWLRDLGWEVYQEVEATHADIVATFDTGRSIPRCWAIECKRTLGWKVIEQAAYQACFAGLGSIAIPYDRVPHAAEVACKALGVGIILVREPKLQRQSSVDEWLRPQRMLRGRRHAPVILQYLHDEQKHYAAAGSSGGAAWSPFKSTCDRIVNVVENEPGITVKRLIKTLDGGHHYRSDATARSCITQWLRLGKVHGIEGRIEGGAWRLYLTDQTPSEEVIQ